MSPNFMAFVNTLCIALQMISVCLLNLDEGKAKHWSHKLKHAIASHFVSTDTDLQQMLASKRGLWSSILGFWQWIIWLINGGNHIA